MGGHLDLRAWLSGLDPFLLNAVTFVLLLLEGMGIPGIPGVIPMLAQVAGIDAGHTTLAAAILWGVLGNWAGSLLGYAAGRWGLRWLPPRWVARLGGERAAALLARYGGPLIIVSRTIGSLRTPVTLIAGTTRYPLPAYVLFSLLGALLHVGLWQTLLLRFGPAILPVMARWGRELLIAAGVLIVGALAVRWWRGRRGAEVAAP